MSAVPSPSQLNSSLSASSFHHVHLVGCPSLTDFHLLFQVTPASTHQLLALPRLIEWCQKLFYEHDRAWQSSQLHEQLLAFIKLNLSHIEADEAQQEAARQHAVELQHKLEAEAESQRIRAAGLQARAESEHLKQSHSSAPVSLCGPSAHPPSISSVPPSHAQGPQVVGPAQPIVMLRDALYTLSQACFIPIRRIINEFASLEHACGHGSIDCSWSEQASSHGIVTYTRTEPQHGTHSFLVEGDVDSPMLPLLALIKEVDLMSHWLPAVVSAEQFAVERSRYRTLARVEIASPWPFANRDVVLYGYGDVVGDAVGVFFRSLTSSEEESDDFGGRWPRSESIVRAQVLVGGMWLTPASQDKTHVRCMFNVDPLLPVVPYWFLNYVATKFCAVFIQMMRKHAESVMQPDSEWMKRIQHNPRVYGDIKRRIAELHKEKSSEACLPTAALNNLSVDSVDAHARFHEHESKRRDSSSLNRRYQQQEYEAKRDSKPPSRRASTSQTRSRSTSRSQHHQQDNIQHHESKQDSLSQSNHEQTSQQPLAQNSNRADSDESISNSFSSAPDVESLVRASSDDIASSAPVAPLSPPSTPTHDNHNQHSMDDHDQHTSPPTLPSPISSSQAYNPTSPTSPHFDSPLPQSPPSESRDSSVHDHHLDRD